MTHNQKGTDMTDIMTPVLDWQPHGKSGAQRATIVLDGIKILLTERTYSYDSKREYGKTTRVFGAIDALSPEFTAEEPYQNIAIPYKPEDALNMMRARVWNAWKNATTKNTADKLFQLLATLAAERRRR